MEKKQISEGLMASIRKAQIDEETGAALYAFMAKREKKEENKKILLEMSRDEKEH